MVFRRVLSPSGERAWRDEEVIEGSLSVFGSATFERDGEKKGAGYLIIATSAGMVERWITTALQDLVDRDILVPGARIRIHAHPEERGKNGRNYRPFTVDVDDSVRVDS